MKIHIEKTLNQMTARFYCCRVITIFPVCPFPVLPLIKLLPGPPGNQLDRVWDDISFANISDEEVNVIRGHHVVEHTQAITLLCLEKPLEITTAVPGKLEQECLFKAAVRNMPNITRYVMSIRLGIPFFHV